MDIMKIVIVLFLFLPILYKVFQNRKWYLYLFFAFYGILPDTFAIEISPSLPLLTAERILILLLLAEFLLKRNRTLKVDKRIALYIGISIFISLVNFRYGTQEINNIFIIILQKAIPLVLVSKMVSNEEELEKCLKFTVASSLVMFVIALLQTTVNFDLSTVFDLVDARVYSSITDRMNLVRASATMNAIQYGSYSSLISILSIVYYMEKKNTFYLIAFVANLLGLLLSMSRSSLVMEIVILALLFLKNKKKMLKLTLFGIPIIIGGVFVISFIKPEGFEAFKEVFNSILLTLGANVSVSNEFGLNANASTSRLMQYTSIYYMLLHGGFVFGLGYQASLRGMVHYYDPIWSSWANYTSMDLGWVGLFSETGIIGLVNYIYFISYIMKINNKFEDCCFKKTFKYLIIFYIVLNMVTACIGIGVMWLMFALVLAKKNIKRDMCVC